ncbi:hypothetical protein [Halorussus caseinilyticus]|uniref:Uncharacterized protein n=1 Tax=Halorussus caseinilyticus TaxID=3034025 RepID=A0ABD5WQ30_9EURY
MGGSGRYSLVGESLVGPEVEPERRDHQAGSDGRKAGFGDAADARKEQEVASQVLPLPRRPHAADEERDEDDSEREEDG